MEIDLFFRLLASMKERLNIGERELGLRIEYENSSGEIRNFIIINITNSEAYGYGYIEADCFSEYLSTALYLVGEDFDSQKCVTSHRTFKISRIKSANPVSE